NGWKAIEQGNFEEARSIAERGLLARPSKSVHTLSLLAVALWRLNDKQRTEAVVEQMLSLSPDFPPAKLLRAQLAMDAFRLQEASGEALQVLKGRLSDAGLLRWALNLYSE